MSNTYTWVPWALFNAFVLVMLAIDLGVFHKKQHEVKFKEALFWTILCIVLALLFNLGIWAWKGSETALAFLTGYLIEQSLSVDNLFVFLLIFSYFKVPAKYEHTILFWGIFTALIMRAVFIFAGIALLNRFHWIIYIFGFLLIATGIKLFFEKDKDIHPEQNPIIKFISNLFPVAGGYETGRFLFKKDNRIYATPLFVVFWVLNITDLIFAVDSIPAILAITRDPFIVYTSNVFAILCLRSMYFVLSHFMKLFHYLHYGLAVILTFIGGKMLIDHFYTISIITSLIVIVVTLALSIAASLIWPQKKNPNIVV